MKQSKSLFLIPLTALLLTTACDLGKPVGETAFTVEDFDNNLLLGYSYLGIHPTRYFNLSEISSDELGIPGAGNNLGETARKETTDLLEHTWTADHTDLSAVWTNCYDGISIINNTLLSSEKIEAQLGDDRLGQARMLRAYYYYLLLDLFGNVQVVTEEDLQDGVLPEIPQLTRKQVFNFVESEIKAALPLLKTGRQYGIFTQDVGQALLAKLYLNAVVYTGQPRWTDCVTACDAVINAGNFSLSSNYLNNFSVDNNVSGVQENMLVARNEDICPYPYYSIHPAQLTPSSPSTNSFRNWAATPELYNAFDHDDDVRANALLIGDQLAANGNQVLDAAGRPLSYRVEYVDSLLYMSGARIAKYQPDGSNIIAGDNDIPILRYADVLLMKAEALNENADLDGAVALINQVRARAYEPDKPLDAGSFNQESLREQLLKERAAEFFWEGHRRQDLIRFNKFCAAWTQKPVTTDCETRKLFPIPTDALEQDAELTQNPGY